MSKITYEIWLEDIYQGGFGSRPVYTYKRERDALSLIANLGGDWNIELRHKETAHVLAFGVSRDTRLELRWLRRLQQVDASGRKDWVTFGANVAEYLDSTGRSPCPNDIPMGDLPNTPGTPKSRLIQKLTRNNPDVVDVPLVCWPMDDYRGMPKFEGNLSDIG